MDTISFFFFLAPWWVFLLAGISGVLIFLRFSFGSLSRGANFILVLSLVVAAVFSQAKNSNVFSVLISYAFMVLALSILLLSIDCIIYRICLRRGKKHLEERLKRQKDYETRSSVGSNGEYY